MCRFMYGGREMAGVVAIVREAQRANENASYDEELASLISTNKTAGTRRRAVAELEAEARGDARESVCRTWISYRRVCSTASPRAKTRWRPSRRRSPVCPAS